MKKHHISALMALFLFYSCGTSPQPVEDEPDFTGQAIDMITPPALTPETATLPAMPHLPPGGPAIDPPPLFLPEPVLELPELPPAPPLLEPEAEEVWPVFVEPAAEPQEQEPQEQESGEQEPDPAAPEEPSLAPPPLPPPGPPPLPPAVISPAEPPPVLAVEPRIRPAEPEHPAHDLFPPPPLLPETQIRTAPEDPSAGIIFSRIVRVLAGQMLEIPFRGTGWVYLGELGNRRGISYDSRRLDLSAGVTEGQSFIFRAETPGTYILRFYRQDFIQDLIIYDHVQVIVGEPEVFLPGRPIDRGWVIAEPRWPPAPGQLPVPMPTVPPQIPLPVPEPEAGEPGGGFAYGQPDTAFGAAESILSDPMPVQPPGIAQPVLPHELSLEDSLIRARQEFDAGRVEQALGLMENSMLRFPLASDEALWLYAQLLEANSPARDIRLSLEIYRRLVREFPRSPRATEAERRIAFLQRHYFNIR
jgi:hypothetical protein